MKHIRFAFGTLMVFAMAAGCSAGDTGGFAEGAADGTASASVAASDDDSASALASRGMLLPELARLEFPDGNRILFEELDGGVLVTELGSELNRPRLVYREGMSALEAFMASAPGREVPPALLRAHEKLYPSASRKSTAEVLKHGASASDARPAATPDADLQHNGQFQQALPAANFQALMCDFPLVGSNYKHPNRTTGHTHTTNDVHTAYFAVGSDIGIIGAQACANGKCGAAISLQAGFRNSGFYDAGVTCEESCGLLGIFGCVVICEDRKVRFELKSTKVSAAVRFHDCASFNQ